MTKQLDKLTPEQTHALVAFSRRWGNKWKEHLMERWLNGSYRPEDDIPQLQRIRNTLGPSWLAKLPTKLEV